MKKFCIITNSYKDKNSIIANSIKEYLEKFNAKCIIKKMFENDETDFLIEREEIEGSECVITIGGDGTLLLVAKELIDMDVVFIGVNKGNLGFMAEIPSEDIYMYLDKLIENKFSVEPRMMLKGEVIRDGKVIAKTNVLNDVVVHRGSCPDISDFTVYVNKSLLGEYSSDGIVISTATGSTAYNLSAGGPIARPESTMIIMTPVCPHTLSNRSVLFSKNDEIELLIKELRKPGEELRTVSFDGRDVINVKTGDIIRVTRAKQTTKIAKINQDSFLQVVNKKLVDGR